MSGAEILYQGITEIDDDLVEAAQSYGLQRFGKGYGAQRQNMRKQRFWIRWGGYSACAAIAAAVLLLLPMSRVTVEDPGVIKEEQFDESWKRKEAIVDREQSNKEADNYEQAGKTSAEAQITDNVEDHSGQGVTGSESGVVGERLAAKNVFIVNKVDQMMSFDMDVRSDSLLDKMPQQIYEEYQEDFRAAIGINWEEFQASIFPENIWEVRDVIRLLNGNRGTPAYQMHDYVFYFRRKADGATARVAACTFEEPLRDYYLSCDTPEESILNQGVSAVVYKWQDILMAQFLCRGIYMDVETNGLAEEELAESLNRIVMSGVHFEGADTVDVPVDESTYHKARTYSTEIMELQERISRAMTDRELPYVIESGIYENPDRVVVTVTTQDETLLAELRAYDTTGRLMEIQYAGERGAALKEDMPVLE